DLEIGTFQGLSDIHRFLFQDIYDFAGKIREVNIAKGNFQFAPRIFLAQSRKYLGIKTDEYQISLETSQFPDP
ncbi:hypothetical protein ACI3PF_22135, partial [Lactococcus lactis]